MVEATVRAIGIEDRRCTSQVGVRGMRRELPLIIVRFRRQVFYSSLLCHYASPTSSLPSPAIIGRVPFGTKAPLVSPPRPTFVNGRCTAERESASRVHIVPLSFRSSTRLRRGGGSNLPAHPSVRWAKMNLPGRRFSIRISRRKVSCEAGKISAWHFSRR